MAQRVWILEEHEYVAMRERLEQLTHAMEVIAGAEDIKGTSEYAREVLKTRS